jgi:hypothetical protein
MQMEMRDYATLKHKEKFEDSKGVTRRRKSKKDRQYNGQKKRDKKQSIKQSLHLYCNLD